MEKSRLIFLIGALLVLGAGVGTAVYLADWKKRAQANAGDPLYGQLMALFASAESSYGIPQDLLARTGFEESSFRPDIINGTQVSSAGAQGIMQFEPATAAQYGVNPLDPTSAIPGAAHYLSDLYRQFGSWSLALAAYNDGPGNVTAAGGIPAVSAGYVSDILSDVNAEGGAQVA